MTTDAEFAPVLPRLATPALAPRPEPVMPPVSEPDVVTDAAADTSAAATTAAATQAVPTAAAPAPAARTTGRSPGRVVMSALSRVAIIVMVVVAAVTPVLLAREAVGPATLDVNGESSYLPSFEVAPPAYGTAQFEFRTTLSGQQTSYQLLANGDASTIQITFLTGELAGAMLLVDPGAGYRLPAGEPVWSRMADYRWSEWAVERTFGSVLAFTDYVPDALRRFVSVADTRPEELDGRAVQYYELLVDVGAAATEAPGAYRTFPFYDPSVGAEDVMRMVLYVDTAGVVWKMETWSDAAPLDRSVVTLQSFGPAVFAPPSPLQYYDEETGVLVGG